LERREAPIAPGKGCEGAFALQNKRNRRLESEPTIERHYVPDEGAVLAALRVVLGLQRRIDPGQEDLS
jgi:hypothetical protein